MPGMNSIQLASNVITLPFASSVVRLQGVREEQATFWVHVTATSGSKLEVRGAPDAAALALGGGQGALLWTFITAGTAAAAQTKIAAGGGHGVVVVQAHPLMMIAINGGLGTDTWNCWLIE